MVSRSKKEYLAKIKSRYRQADRKNKKLILDEFCEVCGHHRKHAIRLLNKDGRAKKKSPGRPPKYGPEELKVIEDIWLNSDRPCASRLVGMIPLWLPAYEKRHGDLEEALKARIQEIPARTLDRALCHVRKKHGTRGLSGTKHGAHLKHRIPIKTSHGDVHQPGFMAADTVAHCGSSLEGDFVWSLTFTDIYSGWTENGAVWNKGQHGVFQMLQNMELRLPFHIKGFHTDNGGEFINHHLYKFYSQRTFGSVEMTRGRPGKSNDNPHVEQKNRTHVRYLLGYERIENQALVKLINELYDATSLFNNYFCANRKLTFKEKRGSKYYKTYDDPATPCDRLMASDTITEPQKTFLTEVKLNLDPYELRSQIDAKRDRILKRLR